MQLVLDDSDSPNSGGQISARLLSGAQVCLVLQFLLDPAMYRMAFPDVRHRSLEALGLEAKKLI